MLYSTAEYDLQVAELMDMGFSESDARSIVIRRELNDLRDLERYFQKDVADKTLTRDFDDQIFED